MEIDIEVLLQIIDRLKTFFQSEERRGQKFTFSVFVVWKANADKKDGETERLLDLMDRAFQQCGFPEGVPTFLSYYLTTSFSEGNYKLTLPLPIGVESIRYSYSSIQYSYLFVLQDSIDTSDRMLTPDLAEKFLAGIAEFLGEPLDCDGANCLGQITIQNEDIDLALGPFQIDMTAYEKRGCEARRLNPLKEGNS